MANTQAILQRAKDAVKRSEQAHQTSQALLAKLQQQYNQAAEENKKVQKKLDQQILHIAQKLDEDTLRFLKALE